MEAAIAAHEAEVAELQAAINSEQQEVQALRVQVEMLRSSSQQKKDGQAAPERFAEALEWCSEVTALINTLVGVSIRRIEEDQLTIGLITHADPGCDANLDAPPQRWEHELALMLEPGKADVANASLQPPDVDISDIAAAAEGGARSLSFVVREVHARLADQLSRAADIGGTQPQGSQPESLPADVHT
ncbi:hypothetical protein COCSUDRAFT_53805 [Coccomyxa subellipsoidea C-169]|uniref:Uncharacterized protein n=1 Tax=Coccomyxa subellipsoidea (strain C-169) TaxID=574566 RepID=I0YVJ6_COCSC|nr:hypothetical protein COCSUDRAFT_53805 [Coccomyxa subellipsoidea C-169]EIE22415.1 hypothetical protein COCSUDRAFT_53805 [Coccomyxa subellipsoidea C-169]|eukprot:XP_005646959.1 hypothetical protein COCSUDRAFT_53805 [Coccomyxa subellipsoidea C-169]